MAMVPEGGVVSGAGTEALASERELSSLQHRIHETEGALRQADRELREFSLEAAVSYLKLAYDMGPAALHGYWTQRSRVRHPIPGSVDKLPGLRVIIDPQSLSYMEGASIDYVDGPGGGGFHIDSICVIRARQRFLIFLARHG